MPSNLTATSAPDPDDAPRKNFRVLPGGAGRPLPHSLEAESQLLGCLLLDPQTTLRRCLDAHLKPSHFYDPKHGLIYETLLDLHRRAEPIDIAVLAEELRRADRLDQVGGPITLVQITDGTPTCAQTGYFLDAVLEHAIRRRMIRDAQAAIEACHTPAKELAPFTADIAAKFQALADFATARHRKKSMKTIALEAIEDATAVAEGRVDKTRWLHFPIAKLDRLLLPLDTRQEDWLVLVAAPPSGAKSSFMRALAHHWLAQGRRGLIFNLENSGRRWLQAMAASAAGLNFRNLEDERVLHPAAYAEFQRAQQWIARIAEDTLFFHDDIYDLDDIARLTRDTHRRLRERDLAAGVPEDQARGLDFVIGDYLQIVTTRRPLLKRTEELAAISRTLKRLHRSLDVPGIWGAQITREARAEGRVPTLADLSESKGLEENADRVLFLHVPPGEDGAPQPGDRATLRMQIWQRKSRNGPKDVAAELDFHRPHTRFSDTTHKTYAPEPGKGVDFAKHTGQPPLVKKKDFQ